MPNKASKEFKRIVIGFVGLLAACDCYRTSSVTELLFIKQALTRKSFLR